MSFDATVSTPQADHAILAGPPSGAAAVPTFRELQASDVPFLAQPGDYAYFTGTISGTSTSVSLSANWPGVSGNSIALSFTGTNTVTAAIATWNGSNPNNEITLTGGDGTQTPTAQNITLAGGLDPGAQAVGNITTYANFTPTSETVAGALRGIDAALSHAGSGTEKVDKFTLTGTDITNKFVTLTFTPTAPSSAILIVEDAGGMFYGVDFTVTGNQLGWSGLELDGIFSSGDNLTVTYSV
jgi:hypothetical protein